MIPREKIRFDDELGGGKMLGLGTYSIYVLRYLAGTEPEESIECKIRTCFLPTSFVTKPPIFPFAFPAQCDIR